jgi:hypothetical protein
MQTKHPRFESLAHAVRAGIQLVPDPAPPRRYFGVSPETGRLGCDALAAAWFAEYYDGARQDDEDRGLHRFLSTPLHEAYPALTSDMGPGCPLDVRDCPSPNRSPGRFLEAKIIHLEDEHGFTREQVALWLQDRRL